MPTRSDRATDPRPARTRNALLDAVQHIAEAGEAVTLAQVLSTSGVSRSSFYMHFTGLDDLALTMLVREFSAISEGDVVDRATGADDVRAIARRAASRLIVFVHEKRDMYRAALDGHLSTQSADALVDAFARAVLRSMDFLDDPPPAALDHSGHARFIAGGAITLLRDWLRADRPVPPDVMTDRLIAAMPTWLVGETEDPSSKGTHS
ncbi:TetR/AcrR family transcriptional regulator [Microbacterium sp. NPDC090225]|uniref:TetR/AcrR family transcriptional regulator n=1 Tax=Microbacterium sp. NPDC090225 TaxID=3364207 RepID=UPI0037F7C2C8